MKALGGMILIGLCIEIACCRFSLCHPVISICHPFSICHAAFLICHAAFLICHPGLDPGSSPAHKIPDQARDDRARMLSAGLGI